MISNLLNRPGLFIVAIITLLLAASRFYLGPGELERTEIYTDFAHVFTGWVAGVWFGVWWIAKHRWDNAYLYLFGVLAASEIIVQALRFV